MQMYVMQSMQETDQSLYRPWLKKICQSGRKISY